MISPSSWPGPQPAYPRNTRTALTRPATNAGSAVRSADATRPDDRRQVVAGLVERLVGERQRDQRVGLDRPAGEHVRRAGLQVLPPIERLAELLLGRSVDHDAERTVVVVLEHEDDRAIEVRVVERRSGDEQPAPSWEPTLAARHSLPARSAVRCASGDRATRPQHVDRHCMTYESTYSHASMVRVGIIGASGFTGAELLRLVAQHPQFEVAWRPPTRRPASRAADLYPGLAGAYPGLVFEPFDLERCDGLDVVFLGLPHEASLALAPQLVGRVGCVVDLSAAYRLKDAGAVPGLLRVRARPAGVAGGRRSTGCPSCTATSSRARG